MILIDFVQGTGEGLSFSMASTKSRISAACGWSSNFGYVSFAATDGEYYSYTQRIYGIFQKKLSFEYPVIEEALNVQMTYWDDPLKAYKRAATQLPFIFDGHRPLDLVTIMLGANGMKHYLSKDPIDSAMGIDMLVEAIQAATAACPRSSSSPHPSISMDKDHLATSSKEPPRNRRDSPPRIGKSPLRTALIFSTLANSRALRNRGVHIDETGCRAIGKALTEFTRKLGL